MLDNCCGDEKLGARPTRQRLVNSSKHVYTSKHGLKHIQPGLGLVTLFSHSLLLLAMIMRPRGGNRMGTGWRRVWAQRLTLRCRLAASRSFPEIDLETLLAQSTRR